MAFTRNNTSYEKSNSIFSVEVKIAENQRLQAEKLLRTNDINERSLLAQVLLNALSDAAGIPRTELQVKDKKQVHGRSNGRLRYKILGFYNPKVRRITLYQRTAVRDKILAPKTFLRTLLHEFMHHYDSEKLRIRSLHTSGFFQRLNMLLEQLTQK